MPVSSFLWPSEGYSSGHAKNPRHVQEPTAGKLAVKTKAAASQIGQLVQHMTSH